MSWNLPSLAALRTFEAAARHLSFTRAALELNITQSAVSRQIRTLEDQLGRRLFERSAQRVALTPIGQTYLAEIRAALVRVQEATIRLKAHQGGGMLRIATPPAFGMRWLIPRLPRFQNTNPDIIVSLITRIGAFDLASEGVDAAFYYGDNNWPDVASVQFLSELVVVVGSPAYLRELGQMRTPQDVTKGILLQHMQRPDAWREWGAAHGVAGRDLRTGPRFEHYYMIIQAVVAGLGLGLVPRTIVEGELAASRLVTLFGEGLRCRESYCLVFPHSAADDPKLRCFRDWLLTEARQPSPQR
jgi:LysR family glycine cleavage system transcriptional activator